MMNKFNVFHVKNVVFRTLDYLGPMKNILALVSWPLSADLFSILNCGIPGII